MRNLQRRWRVSPTRLRRTARVALRALGRGDMGVHVAVVGDSAIRRLNTRHLGHRRPTDVLAFNLEGPGPGRLLGEVIVSADTAARQARRLRVSAALELDLLVVHGILHLLGHDDADPTRARRMHERARGIVGRCGLRAPERLWTGLIDAR